MPNNFKPHCIVLCEDKAIHAIASGFLIGIVDDQCRNQISIRNYSRGIPNVKSLLADELVVLHRYPERLLIILVDFDQKGKTRYDEIMELVPEDLRNRVFILGPKAEAENVKRALGKSRMGPIGELLAQDYRQAGDSSTWTSDQLRHNVDEVFRLTNAWDTMNPLGRL